MNTLIINTEQLATIPWMTSIGEESDRLEIAKALRIQRVQTGEVVCRMGDAPTHWIGVVDGLVKMSGDTANGRAVTYAGFTRGGWFGEGTILKKERYQYDIQALQRSTLAYLPLESFDRLLAKDIAFNQYLMRKFNERLGQFIAWKAAEQTLSLDERLAQALATLFEHDPQVAPGARLKISQQELAYLVGTTRQQVNEALQLLGRAGVVQSEYGGVRLVDLHTLRQYWL